MRTTAPQTAAPATSKQQRLQQQQRELQQGAITSWRATRKIYKDFGRWAKESVSIGIRFLATVSSTAAGTATRCSGHISNSRGTAGSSKCSTAGGNDSSTSRSSSSTNSSKHQRRPPAASTSKQERPAAPEQHQRPVLLLVAAVFGCCQLLALTRLGFVVAVVSIFAVVAIVVWAVVVFQTAVSAKVFESSWNLQFELPGLVLLLRQHIIAVHPDVEEYSVRNTGSYRD